MTLIINKEKKQILGIAKVKDIKEHGLIKASMINSEKKYNKWLKEILEEQAYNYEVEG